MSLPRGLGRLELSAPPPAGRTVGLARRHHREDHRGPMVDLWRAKRRHRRRRRREQRLPRTLASGAAAGPAVGKVEAPQARHQARLLEPVMAAVPLPMVAAARPVALHRPYSPRIPSASGHTLRRTCTADCWDAHTRHNRSSRERDADRTPDRTSSHSGWQCHIRYRCALPSQTRDQEGRRIPRSTERRHGFRIRSQSR